MTHDAPESSGASAVEIADLLRQADRDQLPMKPSIPRPLIANHPPLHPTAQGHAVWAEAIKEPLTKLMK